MSSQRQHRVEAGQVVDDQHEEHHERGADQAGLDARLDRVAAERRADGALLEVGDAGRQGARAQHGREVLGLLLAEAALDRCRSSAMRRVDHRRRDHPAVEDDGEAGADVVAGELAEDLGARRGEAELDDRLVELADGRGARLRRSRPVTTRRFSTRVVLLAHHLVVLVAHVALEDLERRRGAGRRSSGRSPRPRARRRRPPGSARCGTPGRRCS